MRYGGVAIAAISALLGASAAPSPVCAQAAQDTGRSLTPYADSLAAVADTTELRQVAGAAPERDAPLGAHLRYGLALMRLFELTDNDAVRKAAQKAFDRAREIDAGDVWANYGHAWTIVRSPGFAERGARFIPGFALVHSLANVIGTDPVSQALRSLRTALSVNPAFQPAVMEIGRIAIASKSQDDIAVAAAALRHAVGMGLRSPEVYAQLSELELLFGDQEAAAAAARAAVALNPDGSAQRALAVALLARASEMEAGGSAYMSGITADAFADTTLASAYYADVMPLLLSDERERWQDMSPAERAVWLSSFWQRSAAKSARTVGERLREHFVRVRHANVNYQRLGSFGQNAGAAFLIEKDLSLPLDDRGILYIRLGKPFDVITTPAGDVTPPQNETWVYLRDGQFEMYHFHKYKGSSEWALGPLEECDPFFIKTGTSELDRHRSSKRVANDPTPLSGGGIGAASRYMTYLQARARYDARINALALKCEMALNDVDMVLGRSGRSPTLVDAARIRLFGLDGKTGGAVDALMVDAKEWAHRDEEVARRGLRADDARKRYEAPLRAITQLYAFRGNADSAALMAAVLIPGRRFTPLLRDGVHVFPLSLSVILLDSITGKVQDRRDTPIFRADQVVGEDRYFRATLDFAATPAEVANYSIVVENVTTPGEGDIRSGTRAIPAFDGDSLMLSDLVVGEDGAGRWQRGGIAINPIPTHQIERNKSFKLFYEIYNMPPSSPFRTTITVTPEPRKGITGAIKTLVLGKKSNIDLTFDDAASSSDPVYGVQQIRSIGSELDYGSYTITVTVLDLTTQRTAKRSTRMVVLSPRDLKPE
ncbi:MAG TPA: hypothetical protein VF035_07640 [Longimicrobiales bacterium]